MGIGAEARRNKKRQDGNTDVDELKRHNSNTDATDTTDKNGFFSACGGKGRAEGESKSVLIRGIRGIRVAIMPLWQPIIP